MPLVNDAGPVTGPSPSQLAQQNAQAAAIAALINGPNGNDVLDMLNGLQSSEVPGADLDFTSLLYELTKVPASVVPYLTQMLQSQATTFPLSLGTLNESLLNQLTQQIVQGSENPQIVASWNQNAAMMQAGQSAGAALTTYAATAAKAAAAAAAKPTTPAVKPPAAAPAPAAKPAPTPVAPPAVGSGEPAGGVSYSPPSAPPVDTTSNTPGDYTSFEKAALKEFGPDALATYTGTTPWGEQFLSDELTATQAGTQSAYASNWTKGGGLTGFTFNSSVSGADIQKVLGFAEQWEASTGWKYFPPAVVIQDLANQPGIDYQTASAQFFQQLPASVQAQVPGAQFGQSQTQYLQTVKQFQDAYANYTGTPDMPQSEITAMLQANGGQVDSQALNQWIQTNPAVLASSPWVSQGMTYTQWQQYQAAPANIQAVKGRFGTVNTKNMLDNLLTPLTPTKASGGPITPLQRGTINYTSRTAPEIGYQSEVR